MNTTTQAIQSVLPLIIAVGAISLGLGYIVSQFFRGKNDRTKTDIDIENSLNTYLKNQISGFQLVIDEQNKKLETLQKEVSAMHAVIEEKDKTIDKSKVYIGKATVLIQ